MLASPALPPFAAFRAGLDGNNNCKGSPRHQAAELLSMSSSNGVVYSTLSSSPVSPHLVSGHTAGGSEASTSELQALNSHSASSSSSASTSTTSFLPKVLPVKCKIHGEYRITEPVLIELLLSEPVQRLKHVLQHGITGLIGLTPRPAVDRHEHSVGAMLLVRAAGGTIEAQAAALLHDVAHTALSHVVDGVFGYVVHEEDKMEYLETTSIPTILTKHGLDPEYVLEEENFPLLELPAPAICADRLDYGIRDAHSFNLLTLEEARSVSADLRSSKEGKFCFKSLKWAKKLAEAYMKADEYAWSNPTHSLLYSYAADTIRLAHSSGKMQKHDLWREGDAEFWRTMTQSPCAEIRQLAAKVKNTTKVEEISLEEYDIHRGDRYKEKTKVRTIDPDVLQDDGRVLQLTQLDEEYRILREQYLARKSGARYYRIIEG